MKIESDLSLKKARKRNQIEEEEEVERLQLQSVMSDSKKSLSPKKVIYQETQIDIDEDIFFSSQDLYIQQQFELMNVWNRNHGSINENSDSKIDRLSKIIGTLRKNIKSMIVNERKKDTNIEIKEHPEYLKLVEKLERYKMRTEELEAHIIKLEANNQTLKKQIVKNKSNLFDKRESAHSKQEIFYNGAKFQLIKVNKNIKEARSNSAFKNKQATIETNLGYETLLKYIFMLQERLVEGLSISREEVKAINFKPKNREFQIREPIKPLIKQIFPKTKSKPYSTPILEEAKSQNAIDVERPDLIQVGQKLSQIRRQRKKLFNDDDLWKQVEKLQL